MAGNTLDMATQSTDAVTPVLLTRPEAQSQAFAADLVAGFGDRVRPVVSPLMAVEFLSPRLPEGEFAGVIFTSAAGVEAAVRLGAVLPKQAWCVGEKTAERARAAGFRAISADGDADALVAAILTDRPGGRLVRLRGQETRGEVADRLNSAGIETESVVVYRQRPLDLTVEAVELLRQPGVVVVPLFSPRSAALFAKALPDDLVASLRLVAMSKAVSGSALPQHEAMLVAERPDAAAMAEAVGRALS
jgi:uroporphyrinogen-III synthase